MNKFLKSLVLALSLVLGGCVSTPVSTNTEITQELRFPRSQVHQILVRAESGEVLGSCSAVMIGDHELLSAGHCAPDGYSATLDGKKIILLRKSEKADLSLFWVENTCGKDCAILGDLPEVDSAVVNIGYPLGVAQFATEGRVQQLEFMDHWFMHSAPAVFGNSGGGVFQVQHGRYVLVGIHVAGFVLMDPVTHMGLAVRTDVIKEFVKGGLRG